MFRDFGTPEAARLTAEATRNGKDYDQLTQGGATTALSELRQLRASTKISLALTFQQARGQLQALRILLLCMLGEEHDLFLTFDEFVRTFIARDNLWISRLERHQYAPALLLRFVQLKLNTWFRKQANRQSYPPVAPPAFSALFDQLEEDCSTWMPRLPAVYLPTPAPAVSPRPTRGPIPPPATSVTPTAPVVSPGQPGAAAKPKRDAVHNPAYNPIFSPVQLLLKTERIATFIAKAGPVPDLPDGTGALAPMCAAYHLRGTCFLNCSRKHDHKTHTAAEDAKLAAWAKLASS